MPKTLILDIDGTVLELFDDNFSKVESGELVPKAIKGIPEYLRRCRLEGDKIILVTARPEYLRRLTMDNLANEEIPYDYLIMQIGTGPRILVNDRSFGKKDKAAAVNIDSNESFIDYIPYV